MFLDWEKKLSEFEVLLAHVINSVDTIGTTLEKTNGKRLTSCRKNRICSNPTRTCSST